MLLATCVNTPIYCSVFHNLHACVARCSASCVNGPLNNLRMDLRPYVKIDLRVLSEFLYQVASGGFVSACRSNLQRPLDHSQDFTGKCSNCQGVTCECWQVHVKETGPGQQVLTLLVR